MEEFVLALIPLMQSLLAGEGVDVGAMLGGIDFAQWVTIGVKAIAAGPAVMRALPKVIAAAHPALTALKPAFDAFVDDLMRTNNPEQAADNFRAWIAANADVAIKLQPGAVA
jgi:hypothetical protein